MAGGIKRTAIAATVIALSVGCASKAEGILLVITADPGTKVDTLQVGVGSPIEDVVFAFTDVNAGGYEHVHDVLGDGFVSLGSRDLGVDPYRYFISSSGGNGDINLDVVVAAFTDAGGDELDVVAAGLEGITAEAGVVHEYNLYLEPADLMKKEASCTRLSRPDGELLLTLNTDYDCDGYEADGPPGEADCFPFNGNFHPGAEDRCELFGPGIDNNCNGACDEDEPGVADGVTVCGTNVEAGDNFECNYDCAEEPPDGRRAGEICDGFDTDCNPLTLPHDSNTGCFFPGDMDECFFGSTSCNDEAGVGTEVPTNCAGEQNAEMSVPREFCDAYRSDDCIDSNQALDCAYDKGPGVKTLTCALPVTTGNVVCPLKIPVFAARSEDSCRLQILDPRVQPFAVAQFENASTRCDVGFIDFVGNIEGEPSSFELLIRQAVSVDEAHFARVIINTYQVDACLGDGSVMPLCDRQGLEF